QLLPQWSSPARFGSVRHRPSPSLLTNLASTSSSSAVHGPRLIPTLLHGDAVLVGPPGRRCTSMASDGCEGLLIALPYSFLLLSISLYGPIWYDVED
ncbi:hypothetical protein BHE74_00006856, partial [Ensete ventricosum]